MVLVPFLIANHAPALNIGECRPPQSPVGKQPPGPSGGVTFFAASDLGPPLAGDGRPRHDHQVSVEMLQNGRSPLSTAIVGSGTRGPIFLGKGNNNQGVTE